MELEEGTLKRVGSWEALSRWERSELGRDLRRLGMSYGEIMALIPVKKSTLATWCRDVPLTELQIEAIKERTGSVKGIPRDTQRKRREEIGRIRSSAKAEARWLIEDSIWSAGVALYWGEGFKTQGQLGMANADPDALRFFMKWAVMYHDHDAEFRAKINLHADNDEAAARNWWSAELELPLTDFIKTFVKPDGTGHRKNHLERGVCMVRLRKSADAFHRTLAWIEFLQEKLGNYPG
jgi:hypothetical protein